MVATAAPRTFIPPRMRYPENAERAAVPFVKCPVGASLDIFSRKWTFLLLRDIIYYKLDRYGQFLQNNPGLTPRILSRRLGEMVEEGLLVRHESDGEVRYSLGSRGEDAKPMLLALFAYGIKHRAAEVFPDRTPRRLGEVLPQFGPEEIARFYGY